MAYANIIDNVALQDCIQDNLYGGDCKYTDVEITFLIDKIKSLITALDTVPEHFIVVTILKTMRDFLTIKNCMITDYCRAFDDNIPFIETYLSKLEDEAAVMGIPT